MKANGLVVSHDMMNTIYVQ